ncbi:hypothetical protein E2C01_044811 [Portunus trituberculatus]|uniref:Uncharacterized protein n=1 Tax=Portunus trituberculatus TaxID=210409 RepID=A0A5B7FZC6_PORTR|nr:hypothetical protein [Portunus trituberculatus]
MTRFAPVVEASSKGRTEHQQGQGTKLGHAAGKQTITSQDANTDSEVKGGLDSADYYLPPRCCSGYALSSEVKAVPKDSRSSKHRYLTHLRGLE